MAEYGERPRRAGISSFGFSGTNAHLLLEEAPAEDAQDLESGAEPTADPAADQQSTTQPHVWVLSAQSRAAVVEQAVRLRKRLTEEPDWTADAVSAALLDTRTAFPHRAVAIGTDAEAMMEGLAALAEQRPPVGGTLVVEGEVRQPGKIVFVFPGQGSQWPGMARDLAASSPVFRDALRQTADALQPHLDWPVYQTLVTDPAEVDSSLDLERVDVVQPSLFAVLTSLATLWQHHGIHPDAVTGHSQGEIAAAYIAGALSLEDAAKISALRARAIRQHLAGHGAMININLPANQVRQLITELCDGHAEIAAHNAPDATVTTGQPHAITTLHQLLPNQRHQIPHHPRRLRLTQHRSRNHPDDPPRKPRRHHPENIRIPFYSTLENQPIDTTKLDATYWYRNLRNPVHFHTTITQLANHGHTTYIETSPHPVLTHAIETTLENQNHTTIETLRRNQGTHTHYLHNLAHTHTTGHHPTWHNPPTPSTHLPTYPFTHHHYWYKPAATADVSAAGLNAAEHPLLSASVASAEHGGVLLTGRFSAHSRPWLVDHAVFDAVVLPGTAFVELALRAGREAGCGRLAELTLEQPLVLPEDGAVRIQVAVSARGLDRSAAGVRVFVP